MRSPLLSAAPVALIVVTALDQSHARAMPTHDLTHPSGSSDRRILGLSGRPFGLDVTANGDVLVTEQNLNQLVHLRSTGTVSTTIRVGHDPGDVVARNDGTAFVSGFFDGTISLVNLGTNRVTRTIRLSPTNAYRLALSPDGAQLYVTSTDNHLYVINTGSRRVARSLSLVAAQGLAVDHAGAALYVSATSGLIWRLDLPHLTRAASASLRCRAQDIAISQDDAEVYVACEDGRIEVLNPRTLDTKATIALPDASPFGLAVTPDNAQLYVASAQSSTLTIIDRKARSVIKTLTLGGVPRRVAFNESGNKAYIANEGGWVDVIQ